VAAPALYVTRQGQLALQSSGIAGWTNPKIDLCSALPAPPAFDALIADFTLAAYTSYAQQTFTLTGGFVDTGSRLAFSISGLVKFPSATAAFESEIGAVIQDGMTHVVWAWIAFGESLPELTSTDLIALVVQLFENLSSAVTLFS